MVNEFEQFFTYYWKNDKNFAVTQEEDEKIIREIPTQI